MATEAEKPEDISVIMKIKEEIKELDCSPFDATVSKASLGEFQKVEDEHSSPLDIVGNSTKTEVLEVATDAKDNGNHVLEGKVGHSEGESFLISPSVANIASEESCRASDVSEEKESSVLVEKEAENVMQLGEQNLISTSMENGRVEEETANSATELVNGEECVAEKFPSLPIASPSIEQNEQQGQTEGGEDQVVEEKKLVENSQAVHAEQKSEAICATQTIQEEEVATDSKKDELEEKTSSEDPSSKSSEQVDDERMQATPDDSLDLIKENVINDDESAGDLKSMEVSTEKNVELLACSNGEVDVDKQGVEKTNSEGVTEIKEQDNNFNLQGTEEIEMDKKAEAENPQAVLEDEETASHKLDIPSETTVTEEVRSLTAEPNGSGKAEHATSLSLEEEKCEDNTKEEISKGLKIADSDDCIDKTIIQEDEDIKGQSTATFGEEIVQSSQEDEKVEEKPETEVSEGRGVEAASKHIDEQIIEEHDVVKDHCTEPTVEEAVKQSNQEDEKEAKEFEKEDCIRTETITTNDDNQITASEDSDSVKDQRTVSVGEETIESSNEYEEAKKPKIEVFEGNEAYDARDLPTVSLGKETQENEVSKEFETTRADVDTEKESIDEHGTVTDITAKEIGNVSQVTTTEHYIEQTASEDNNAVKDHSTVPVEEEAAKESSQEDEIKNPEVKVPEINDANEDTEKQTVVDIVGEGTTNENSQEVEACKELETTDANDDTVKESEEDHAAVSVIGAVAIEEAITTGEHVQKTASEDNNVVKEQCTVSVGDETAKENSEEDAEAKNPQVEVFEGLETNGASEEIAKHITEDAVATYLSTESVDKEAIKESSKEDEVHEKTEEVGEAKVVEEHNVKEEIAATDIPTISLGEETVSSSQEDEVCKELETTGPSEDAIKESVEENEAVTDICEVAVGELTTREDSQEVKEAKSEGEVVESEPISQELKTSECTQNTEIETKHEEAPIKSPTTSAITEASGEEIQEELNEKLAGSSLESEVSEDHIVGEATEKENITCDNLETESVTIVKEQVSLDEAEPEGVKLIDASDLPSEEISPVPIEANGTSLQALHDEEVKVEENPNSEENTLITENQEADGAKDEMEHNTTQGASVVPKPESDDHETEVTSGTETAGILPPPTNESEKLQETPTPSSGQQDRDLVEANEKVIHETPVEDKIQDEKPENITDEIRETNEMDSSEIVKVGDGEVLEKSSQKDDLQGNQQERCIDLVSEELETVDSSKYNETIISDKGEEPEKKPEESFKEEMLGGEVSEIDHTRETELQKEVENVTDLTSTQQNLKQVDSCEKIQSLAIDDSDKHKDDSAIPSLEPRVEIKEEDGQEEAHKATEATETDHEETDGQAASGLMQKSEMECENIEEIDPAQKLIGGDEVEEAMKNLEEEKKGAESSEIDRTRETELKDEVENFCDLASTHENLKPDDASEKIQSAETGGSYQHEDESSMPNLKPSEINQEDGREEAQVIEATEECKSPEIATLDHDEADELAASGIKQTIEMEWVNPESIDPAENLRGASESVAENQSHVTLDETEEEGKTIKDQNTESNEDHIIGQTTQEEEMESKKLEETVPTLEPEELNHEVNYETTENRITTEKVPGDVEKAGESEEIEKQIIEEDVASKELAAVCIQDEAVKEVTDSNVVPSEQNIEVTDSNDNTEIPKKEDSEKLLEVSTLKSEEYEENNKETDDPSGVLQTESVIVAKEETNSQEIEPEVEKIVLGSGIGSEEQSLERVETTEIGLMGDEEKNVKVEEKSELVSQPPSTENRSVKLEEKLELVSQPPITEDGNQNQEDLTEEKLDASKCEEEIKDELVIESDHAVDQLPTFEKTEEKLQESSALVPETQELEVSAMQKIKDFFWGKEEKINDNPTIEGASDILHDPEIETMVDQNVEADKAYTLELQVPAETREINAEIQLEDRVHDKKNMDALSVTNTEATTSPEKEDEYKDLVSDMGIENVEDTPNAKPMKEGENLETTPNFVPEENVSESKDVAAILDWKETAELTESREDSKNDNLKDDRSIETETKEESESEGLGKCLTEADEETETDGASVNTVKDVLDESSTEVNKGGELTISSDNTGNDNPNTENSEAVNLTAKTPNDNENDSSIVHSLVEETLVGKVGGESDEASNLEGENLKESLESVPEAQLHETLLDTEQNEENQTMTKEVSNEEVHAGLKTTDTDERNEKEIPGEEGSVVEPHPISVHEPVKENLQDENKGEQFEEATTKSGPAELRTELEAEEDQTGKTNEAPETITKEIVNEEIKGLENAGASEADEKPITEEKEAAKNPYEKWENMIKEEATTLDLEDQNHEVPCRDHTTENEEILQELENDGPSETNEELIPEKEEAVTNPYEKWEKQIKEAATKLDLEDQNHEPPCKDTAENEEILPVETKLETTIPTESRETIIVKDEEGPNENLHNPPATNAPCKEAAKEETGDLVVEDSSLVPDETISTYSKIITSATEDETAPDCQLEVDNLKNSTSELASKPIVVTEDVLLKDEAAPTNVDAPLLAEASEEAIREKEDDATYDEGRHIAEQALAEVGPPTEGSEGQHIKDEAPEEEILKKEAGKMLDEAHIQEKECENEDMNIQIPKLEENQVSIAAEQATADGSIMDGTDKSSKTSDLVVVDQCQQVHESEKTETTKLEDVDSFNEKLGKLPNVQIAVKDFSEEEATMNLAEDNETPQSVEKIEKPIDMTNEEQGPREVTLNESTETNISTGSTETPSAPKDLSEEILERTSTEVQKPWKILEIEPEFKGAECEQDEESNNEPKPSDSDKISLSELIQRSEKETPVEESESLANKELLETKVPPTIQVEEEAKEEEEKHEEVEEEDEHKKTDSGSDAPVMVEASSDVDAKPTPSSKKSHNILSGVGSKVKHSIIKVKKAITGKSSSHQKSTSPKKEKEDGSTETLKTDG